jgi:hypothetical protein
MARAAVVPIRVSETERRFLYDEAKQVGLSLSSFVRLCALKRRMPPPPVPEVNRTLYQELCRIGNNLNQLARSLHEGRVGGAEPAILSLLLELKGLVKEVGMKVYGVENDRQTN